MPVRVDISKAQKKEDSHIQYLPCGIDYNGPAEIERHFTLSVTQDESEVKGLDGRIRGHPLRGSTMRAPEGYTGVVLKDSKVSAGKGAQVIRGMAKFDCFTYWNWDRQPSRSDKYQQALDWLEVASVIHGTDN